jgi:hypothetical protein
MMKIKVNKEKEITNTKNLEIIAKILNRKLKDPMRKRLLIEKLRIITREIVKIEVNMITEITEINVTTETTIEEITEVTTTEDPIIIMTEMIEMTDNITEEEGEEEMTMIMTMTEKITENTETTSVEIEKTEVTEMKERELTNLSMMIIRKMSKKKRKIKHHN